MKNNLSPAVNPKDLTEASLKKAVLKKATGSGLFQYPLFALAGLVGVGILSGFALPILLGVGVCAGASSISWLTDMFVRDEKIKLQYILQLKKDAEKQIEEKTEQLSDDLRDVDLPDAATQLEQFQTNYKNFVFILDEKFNPGELAYNRYSVIVQQIVLAGMNNIQKIYLKKKNLMDANPKDISKTLEKLKKTNLTPTPAQQSRMDELQKRLDMYKEEGQSIDELLAQNEKALTGIGNVSRTITALNTDGNLSSDMEGAMQDLIEMTDFAKVLDSNYKKEIVEVK